MGDWYCDEVLSGVRPIGVIEDTPSVLAFHHTRPSYDRVHVVVIPKAHVPSLLSSEADSVLPDLLSVVRSVAASVLEEEGACRVVTNLGRYQESAHLHWHIVSGDRINDPVEVEPPEWWNRYPSGS